MRIFRPLYIAADASNSRPCARLLIRSSCNDVTKDSRGGQRGAATRPIYLGSGILVC